MKRAQRLKDMSNRAEKRALVNGNGELKSIINNESNNLHNLIKGPRPLTVRRRPTEQPVSLSLFCSYSLPRSHLRSGLNVLIFRLHCTKRSIFNFLSLKFLHRCCFDMNISTIYQKKQQLVIFWKKILIRRLCCIIYKILHFREF